MCKFLNLSLRPTFLSQWEKKNNDENNARTSLLKPEPPNDALVDSTAQAMEHQVCYLYIYKGGWKCCCWISWMAARNVNEAPVTQFKSRVVSWLGGGAGGRDLERSRRRPDRSASPPPSPITSELNRPRARLLTASGPPTKELQFCHP